MSDLDAHSADPAETREIERRYALVCAQVSLYEMSYNDPQGLDPESTMACIGNIVDYGHPAGEEAARGGDGVKWVAAQPSGVDAMHAAPDRFDFGDDRAL